MNTSKIITPAPDFKADPADAGAPANDNTLVNGAKLLDDTVAAFKRHLVVPDGAAEAMALWAMHTHTFEAWEHSPRLLLTSPTPGCGKTEAMKVLSRLCARPEIFDLASESAILRFIDEHKAEPCSLFFDEADTFFGDKPKLKGVLNAGYERGKRALLSAPTKDNGWKPETFELWAPVVIAGIKRWWLWPALIDRAIDIKMRKRLPSEAVEKFKASKHGKTLDALATQAAQWAKANMSMLKEAEPEMPAGVYDRDALKWTPLIAIADVASGRWPMLARRVAQAFVGAKVQAEEEKLIADIWNIFEKRGADRLRSEELSAAVGLSASELAMRLADFQIRPRKVRFPEKPLQGYLRSQFALAAASYVPAVPAVPAMCGSMLLDV